MANNNKMPKKEIRRKIAKELENVFRDLEDTLGRSKFRSNIKKASKALTTNLKRYPATEERKRLRRSRDSDDKAKQPASEGGDQV